MPRKDDLQPDPVTPDEPQVTDNADAQATPDHRRQTVESAKVQTAQVTPAHVETERERALSREVKRQTDQLDAINNVITAASRSPDLQHTLQAALDAVLTVIPLEASGISLIDRQANELVMCAQRGWKRDFTTTPMRIKLGAGLSGQAVTSGEIVITGDLTGDPRLAVPAFAEEHIKAMALVPMRARGNVIGVLSVMSRAPYAFTDGEIKTLRVIADQVGLALDNVRLSEISRAQQSRLEAVLNATADAIIATDDAGLINLVNPAAEALFGFKAEMILGKPLRDAPLLPIRPEEMQAAMVRDDPDLGVPTSRMIETRLINERYILGFVSPVYSPHHAQITQPPNEAWVVVFQDITHLKAAELARILFIQTAAHELRNPLSVTLSALTMLRASMKDPSPRDLEIYEIAMRGMNRMQDLIDDLLDLEHIESGVGFRSAPVDIGALVVRCAEDMQPMLESKQQTLSLAVESALPHIDGDERWLYRALANLVSNAHKYTPDQTHITIRAGLHGSELMLQVEDNGPGIPREALTHLFERFYRAPHPDQSVTGTGLGLSIVKSVAERHGGRAFVRSELPVFGKPWRNRGSVFGMALPIRQTAETG